MNAALRNGVHGTTKKFIFAFIVFVSQCLTWAPISTAEPRTADRPKLSEKLDAIRFKRLAMEKALIETERSTQTTQEQLERLKVLQRLQVQEKILTQRRLTELKKYLFELNGRKEDVLKRIREEKFDLKSKLSKLVHPILYREDQMLTGMNAQDGNSEAVEQLKRHIYSKVVLSELKQLESLNADLQDAEDIQARIEREQAQMVALIQDFNEQESLIQFHQKLRETLTQEKQEERLKQLEEYRNLRSSEIEIERMIEQFQTRQEHEKTEEKKKMPVLSIRARSLPWPLKGRVVGNFGPQKESKTGLTIFRKGIQMEAFSPNASVYSVMDGVVQYAGDIPGKGRVLIVEHPRDLYSVYGGVAALLKKVGDPVMANEQLATVESQFYFEIRSRNLAIDPLKWLQ